MLEKDLLAERDFGAGEDHLPEGSTARPGMGGAFW
jgi:hypothetical protein